mgnify:CR=1 FL=1
MERKMCLNTYFRRISFPKDKQSMISRIGYNVENSLGKVREISWHYPYNGVWIIEQETFSIGLQMFLLKIGLPQTCFGIALSWSSSKNRTLDTQRIQAIRIDKLPCRGAPHNPTRLFPFGQTHFSGSCPASEDQHVAAPPRLNREVSTPV